MTPPFPEICTKDLCRDDTKYAKGSYFRNCLGFMHNGQAYTFTSREWGGGLAPPPPTLFLAAGNFLQFTYKILNYHLVPPLANF